jgi:hypothetical protein
MDLDLSNYINKDISRVIYAFKSVGFSHEDENYIVTNIERNPNLFTNEVLVEKYISEPENLYGEIVFGEKSIKKLENILYFGILLRPKILSYDNKQIVWIECRIVRDDEEELYRMINYLKEDVFPKLPFQPFFDEDAFKGNFSRIEEHKEKGTWYSTEFYVNPDYKDGYWENHVIS